MRPGGNGLRGGLVGLPPIMGLYTIVPLGQSSRRLHLVSNCKDADPGVRSRLWGFEPLLGSRPLR